MSRFAVLTRLNAPLEIREAPDPELKAGQVRVKIICTGICGSQLMEITGEKGNAKYIPHCMGHEAAGIVEEIGDRVYHVKPGDRVVMHWRKGEGIEAPAVQYDGLSAGPIHTWCDRAVVSGNRVTVAPHCLSNESVALMGCCLSTAMCCAREAWKRNTKRAMIIGCGGVGLSLVHACMAYGIVPHAYDKVAAKMAKALEMGGQAPTQWQYGSVYDTTGVCLEDAMTSVAPGGEIVLIGQHQQLVTLSTKDFFKGEGITIRATEGGGFDPASDIPTLSARLKNSTDPDSIITHWIGLEDVNEGIELMKAGKTGKIMIYPNA
jgi:S-(hydroxymethyl)glutathione dehydrogenase/alcohol dehydrogenase